MLNHNTHVMAGSAAAARHHLDHEELARLFRAAVQEAVAAHLAAGSPVFSCGLGEETGKVFMHTPDGRRFEVRRGSDGSYDRLADASQ